MSFTCTRIKSKTTKKVVWFQSLLPSLLITTSSLGILFPSLGIFVETVLEALLILYLISYFEIADKWLRSKSEDPWHPAFYFLQVCFFFIMLWLKQIMFFMDIIRNENDSFWNFSYRTIVKLLDLSMNVPAVVIAGVKIRILHQTNSLPNVGICIIIWYFLFQALWLFFMFLQGMTTEPKCVVNHNAIVLENAMFKGLSLVFNADSVAHFVKNIMKTFLVVIIGFPYCQNCVSIAEKMQDIPDISDEADDEQSQEPEEENTEVKIEERRNSDISFFSFKDTLSL